MCISYGALENHSRILLLKLISNMQWLFFRFSYKNDGLTLSHNATIRG